jgi:hypothetical protein
MACRGVVSDARGGRGEGRGAARVGFPVRADIRGRFGRGRDAAGWSPAGAGGAGGRDGDPGSRPAVRPSGVNPKKARPEMRAETGTGTRGEGGVDVAMRTWNWSSLHMGVTDTRGYLGAREALKVLGLRMEGGGFSRQPCLSPTAVRGAGNARDGDGGDDAHLWKTGEKRFFSSFTLEPPFFTAFAALAALALASSVGTTGGGGSRQEGARRIAR